MTRLAVGYLLYLLVSLGVTVFVGKRLHHHGRLFVIDALHGHVRLAETVNDLLLVGFYLLNIAIALLLLRSNAALPDDLAIATFLADKLAVLLFILGGMHFVNVSMLMAIRRCAWDSPTKLMEFLD